MHQRTWAELDPHTGGGGGKGLQTGGGGGGGLQPGGG